MNEPGQYKTRFTQMVATKANRTLFIGKAKKFCKKHGFDGVDLDWEHPGLADRGGRPSDKTGLVNLAKEFKAAAPKLLLTMAIGAHPHTWASLDMPALKNHIDFFNVMTYDYHGAWDAVTGYNAPWIDPAGSPDIAGALKHYITDSKVPPSKLNLGLAAFGRTWTLKKRNPDFSLLLAGVGAAAVGAGTAGVCLQEPGVLSWQEVKQFIAAGARVTIDSKAMSAYAVSLVDRTQWASFDLPQTLYGKMRRAKAKGLGGVMVRR
jgi:chitinase